VADDLPVHDRPMQAGARRGSGALSVLVVAVAVVLAGCGGDDSGSRSPSSTRSRASSTTTRAPTSSTTSGPQTTTSTTGRGAVPASVSVLQAGPAGGSGEVEVVWRGVSGATGYRVERADAADGAFGTAADYDAATGASTKAAGVTNVYFTDERGFVLIDVLSGPQSRRYYRVVAYNRAGDASPSPIVCGAPPGASC
jgi:hypothetical protein